MQFLWAYGLCKKCDSIKKFEAQNNNDNDDNISTNKKYSSIKRTAIKKKKKKPTGQYKMFEEIWEKREHVSQISGLSLVDKDHPRWVSQFEHILPKGSYKDWMLETKNIYLMTEQEHFDLTNNTHKCMIDPMYDTYFELKQKLKEEYNAEHKLKL